MEKYINDFAVFFNDGGEFMWVISVVFAFAIAIVIERVIFMYVVCRGNPSLRALDAAKAIEKNDEKAILAISKRSDPLSILLFGAIKKFKNGTPIDEIREGLEEDAILQIPRIYARINYLSLVANAATLLGLLGTIQGLQLSFGSLGELEAAEKAAALSRGISLALNTTAIGLVVAIACMFSYTFLSNKKQKLINAIDDATVRFMNFLAKEKAEK